MHPEAPTMTTATRRPAVAAALFAAALTAAGCVTAPMTLLDGELRTRTDPTLYPVRIVAVDGHKEFRNPVQVPPGQRLVVFEAAPGKSARGTVQKTIGLRVEPCTRYSFAARRASAMDADWELVVGAPEPVAACDPQVELEKARKG